MLSQACSGHIVPTRARLLFHLHESLISSLQYSIRSYIQFNGCHYCVHAHVCAALFLICPHYFHSILRSFELSFGGACAMTAHSHSLTHQFNESAASERNYYVLRFTISLFVSHSFVFNLQTPHTLSRDDHVANVCLPIVVFNCVFVAFRFFCRSTTRSSPKIFNSHIFFSAKDQIFSIAAMPGDKQHKLTQ